MWAEFYFEDFDDEMRQRVSLKDAWVTKVENITETGTFELHFKKPCGVGLKAKFLNAPTPGEWGESRS